MKLSEIEATLRQIRVAPVKTLGQNFLHDRNLSRWITDQTQLTAGDLVVEIGPGLGALTVFALAAGVRVLAIEKDARLASFLRERFAKEDLEVRHEDALEFDVRTLYAFPRVKLIGNLPYYVASQLLINFTSIPSPISLFVLMLQKEMAKRITATPGSSAYGALTLLMQRYYRIEYLRTIPPTVFIPEPDVDSAVVRLLPRGLGEVPDHDPELFQRLVRLGFAQRRKQLQKLLRDEIADWQHAAETGGFDLRARAEELSLLQWIALTNFVGSAVPEDPPKPGLELFPVVDENDRLLRLAPRAEVHGNNLRHRAVHIYVFNARGELFLQKRSRYKDRYPGAWDSSAAGHLEGRETYDEAARRELEEELGISLALEEVAMLPPSEQTGQEFIRLYHGEHEGPFRVARSEIEFGRFFPTEIVTKWIVARPDDFAPGFLECWGTFGRKGGL
ncbi:MAG: 16S rRNA (adenine(1518)-N(6)/adenine(1519)-N(6))-dimethyltransferase RsmA [Chthoniobacterales bacterium]